MTSVKGVAILGSTGSIGRTTLDVIQAFPDRFRVVALTAKARSALLLEQVERFRPEYAALAEPDREAAEAGVRIGWEAVLDAASHPEADIVVNGVVGAAGLEPSIRALEAGKRLALANKESLVAGGPLVLAARQRGNGELVPVDSEHSAIFQCLGGSDVENVRRIVLTASGGPFRGWNPEDLERVTPEEALRHPTWDMGDKITIDSATLVNKALEVIEAHFLFGLDYDRISVVIHPGSIVHSLVEFRDGSTLAQLGRPTMAVPILHALAYPERLEFDAPDLDLAGLTSLEFEALDQERYPAFRLGVAAGERGGTMPSVFNAVNEEAVTAFLEDRLPYTSIPELIELVLSEHTPEDVSSLEIVKGADSWARARAREHLQSLTTRT